MEYVIGLDFGTLSVRAVIFSVKDGKEIGEGVSDYRQGVISETLPDGTPLGQDYALESPQDMKESLKIAVTKALDSSKVSPDKIIGIGIDSTTYSQVSCTKDGLPLCELKAFEQEPMAWIKLWKHHGAQQQSDKLSEFHKKTDSLHQCNRYGGVFNCEWALPKLLETYEKSPEVFHATYRFCDLGEWIAWILSGKPVASLYSYGFKCLWSEDLGFPSTEALNKLSCGFGTALYNRMASEPEGYSKACGYLTEDAAEWLGLKKGTAVACPIGDGSAPGISICARHRNSIAITYGTSVAMAFINDKLHELRGINGVVKDCYYPGLYAYDAGQPCAGDMLAWLAEGFADEKLKKAAGDIPIQTYLTQLAEQSEPYKNRLTVLDWFGGNRSIINDSSLKGVIAGLGLDSKIQDIYTAMIQGICCGSKKAVDYFAESGIVFDKIIVFGGIADNNRFFLKQLASVFDRKIHYCKGYKITALGSAILAAVAAGKDYDSVLSMMCPNGFEEILPDEEHKDSYRKIYSRWCNLHDRMSTFY